jgi:TetR/AcrR family transcriptional regulator
MRKVRDLARTRERILEAALGEFAAHGLGGARCGDIARRAGVNKRMLFYCFGSKEALYREILRRKFTERADFFEAAPDDLADAIIHWYEAGSSDLEWVRLLEWEALGAKNDKLVGEDTRRDYFTRTSTRLRRAQARGRIPRDLDLSQLQISMIALTVFPLAFPQMTRLATGLAPTDPRFRRKRMRFLRWLGQQLSPEALPKTPRVASPRSTKSVRRRPTSRSVARSAVTGEA